MVAFVKVSICKATHYFCRVTLLLATLEINRVSNHSKTFSSPKIIQIFFLLPMYFDIPVQSPHHRRILGMELQWKRIANPWVEF